MLLQSLAILLVAPVLLYAQGLGGQGQDCDEGLQCNAGLYCDAFGSPPSYTCYAPLAEGASCAYYKECEGGTVCTWETFICTRPVTVIGGSCAGGPRQLCTSTSDGQQLSPFIDGSSCTCLVTASEGQTCGARNAPPCLSPLYCGNGRCVGKVDIAGGSCMADPGGQCGVDPSLGQLTCANGLCIVPVGTVGGSCQPDAFIDCTTNSIGQSLYCQAGLNGDTCQRVGTNEYANCAGDLSGNSCAAPRYCTGPNAPVGSQNQCRTKASRGGSCAFDPVNGCSTGLYCTSTDQTCQPISTQAGQSCGPDSNACQATASLYCVAATQLCAQKATMVGASCSFDLTDGCASTSDRQQLYCRGSDATCQVRLNSIGADCRADPISACGTATAADGAATPLYCSAPTFLCAAQLGAGASCASNPSQACASPYYCSSNNDICLSQVTKVGGSCNADPYAQCGLDPSGAFPGYNGQLYPLVQVDRNGNQFCLCNSSPGPTSVTPVPGTFGLTAVGDDCSSDPTFACGYSSYGVKLYCARSTNTCQVHVTTAGESCAYDYLGACGITTDGTLTQLYPSIPVGSSGHADCTCVTQADVVVRPSSRARARARSRRNLSLCPGSHTACPVGDGFECIDVENNIEQCGGCSENGGVDCTALEGVAAVGCVGGKCEIWACEEGYSFVAAADACV